MQQQLQQLYTKKQQSNRKQFICALQFKFRIYLLCVNSLQKQQQHQHDNNNNNETNTTYPMYVHSRIRLFCEIHF